MGKNMITRRQFLGSAAAAAAFTIVPRHVLGGAGRTPPSEKLNIAGIGSVMWIGGMQRVPLQSTPEPKNTAISAGCWKKRLKTSMPLQCRHRIISMQWRQ
ncbi:MAG: hypothetical protein ACYSU5_22330 [Planctomycetota bacterium]